MGLYLGFILSTEFFVGVRWTFGGAFTFFFRKAFLPGGEK